MTDESEVWELLGGFQDALVNADKATIQNSGTVPIENAEDICRRFRELALHMNVLLGVDSPLPQNLRSTLGRRIQTVMLPSLWLTGTVERTYSKPHGYAGDFRMIQGLYDNIPRGHGRLGPLIDRCYMDQPACVAVQNRRGLLRREIEQTIRERSPNRQVRVTTLACGPAQEIFDVFEQHPESSCLCATLIDLDDQALAFVRDKAVSVGRLDQLVLHKANLLYLAAGRKHLEIPPQDLIYSIGLIDYFPDKYVIALMNYAHGLLRQGGRLILGNFHPRNPSKALMEYVLEWKLIHRTEDDLNRLYEQSHFACPATRIQFEEQGINLFAECVKR